MKEYIHVHGYPSTSLGMKMKTSLFSHLNNSKIDRIDLSILKVDKRASVFINSIYIQHSPFMSCYFEVMPLLILRKYSSSLLCANGDPDNRTIGLYPVTPYLFYDARMVIKLE